MAGRLPPGTVLTREHAMRSLTGHVLGVDRDRLDSAGLLEWTLDAPAVLEFTKRPTDLVTGIAGYLAQTVGPAADAIMSAVRAGHGVDAIPLGLLAGGVVVRARDGGQHGTGGCPDPARTLVRRRPPHRCAGRGLPGGR